ncbi:MAG: hypothetical protein K2O08_03940 [Clostridia bacterium]|nr:hypothetical protein [Clostridia bacterium]
MKKSLTIILVIILLLTFSLSLTGCNKSFGAKNVREQIESNLGWHQSADEVCVYDVFDGDLNVGTHASEMSYVYKENVTINSTIEDQNRTLDNFSGYKFITQTLAEIDGVTYERYTESYADLNLSPAMSYTKEVTPDKSTEIITSYDEKRINVTFIIDGEISESSVKYKSGAMLYDNSYVYQFARATDLTSSLAVSVPTYNISNGKTEVKKSNFSMSYLSGITALLDNDFLLERQFVQAEGETSENTSGAFDEKNPAVEETDEDGKVTVTYPFTKTSSIPSYRCTFTSTDSSLVRGSVSCCIAVNPMKMQDGGRFSKRVVVMMQEGKMTYKLKSVEYSLKI